MQSSDNRQGRGDVLQGEEAERVQQLLREDSDRAYQHYTEMLNTDEEGKILDPNRSGLARELARMNLSLNFYTQWYWKTDLHNLMHFLSLRADPHAQHEIQVYAEVMLDTMKRWVPMTHAAFLQYRTGGLHLSEAALRVVRRMLAGETVTQEEAGLGAREWRELMASLKEGAGS